MGDDISVRRGGADDIATTQDILRRSYERQAFGDDWFEWKHHECPWGPSRLLIAEDADGVLGVVFALPWPFRVAGEVVDGARFVDGGTLPPARGRRVLSILCADELARWNEPERPGILLATATPAAQKSHERNGAVTLDPIASAYGVARSLRPAKLVHGTHLLDDYVAVESDLVATAWTPDALRWRIDPRSGHDYRVSSLASSDGANGLVYRIDRRRGVGVLLPIASWGSAADRRRLVGAVSLRTGSPVVLAPVGPGAPEPGIRAVRPSGSSVMCVWDRRAAPPRPATSVGAWSLEMADLAGLI